MNYEKALKIATKYHKGQKRNKSGLDYITHPIEVANKFEEDKLKQIAIMHDTIEDTELTIEKLIDLGFSGDVIKAIDLLTKRKNQDYIVYLKDIKENELAMRVKIEDIKHNLSDLERCNLRDKYLLSLDLLLTK